MDIDILILGLMKDEVGPTQRPRGGVDGGGVVFEFIRQ